MRTRDIFPAYFVTVGGLLTTFGWIANNTAQVRVALATLCIGVVLAGIILYDDYRG